MSLDDDYANSIHIPNGEGYYARWDAAAAAFRARHGASELGVVYGDGARCWYDMFHPSDPAKGTVVFVHGGYWLAASPSMFSHLAAGAVAAGYACAMPAYTLAPDARLAQITRDVHSAIGAIAARTDGPIYLVGHSAGGHLVARMACVDVTAPWQGRVARIMAISPLGDLAPLMQTTMNDTLKIDAAEAIAESPIHHPRHDIDVTAWVGGAERPAFLDQAAGLAQAWACDHVVEPDRHHFDVIEGLEDAGSAMMRALLN